jgi:fructokinase
VFRSVKQLLDVICVGEALVDFLPLTSGKSVRDVETWQRCVGGAPANVAIGLARLGARCALNGVVGEDEFGHFLKRRLEQEGVDVSHLRLTPEGRTGLSFVSLTQTGERSFSFYRANAAEQFFGLADVKPSFAAGSKIIHFGLNSLRRPEAREAALKLLEACVAAGRIVSCDPNVRLHLWEQQQELKSLLDAVLPRCSVVKMSLEETEFVLGVRDPEAALRALAGRGVTLPVITCGSAGAMFFHRQAVHRLSAPTVAVVDTTGAGDGFSAGLLYGLSRLASSADELRNVDTEALKIAVELGCRVGAHAVEKLGASAGLPTRERLSESWPRWFELEKAPQPPSKITA